MRTSQRVTVRPAKEQDLTSIRRLLAELIEAVQDAGSLDLAKAIENCAAMLRDPASHILVAQDGRRVAGFISFTARQSVMHPGPSGLIDELVVTRAVRSRGVGRLLVQAAAEECRRLGCCELEVSTEKANTVARRFYRSCGFVEDAVLLEMDL